MTPAENALVAYAILESAENDRAGGVDPAYIALDIARAQVYATLATVDAKPSREDVMAAVYTAAQREGVTLEAGALNAAAEAVARLL